MSESIINQAIKAVADIVNDMGLFATMTRGALGTEESLVCGIGPSNPETVWLDKNQYIPIDFTINGKHKNLETLSDAMNLIHETLTMMFVYPAGDKWQITDIATLTEPQVIGREQDNRWIMASALLVKVATFTPDPVPDPEPTPDPDPDPDPDPPVPDPEQADGE